MHTRSHFFNNALRKVLSIMAVFLLFSAAVYGQFAVVSPAQDGVAVSQTPTFSWTTPDPGPYHIQVFEAIPGWTPASDPNYDGAKMVYENTSVAATSITPGTYTNTSDPTKLDAKKRYVWFLKTSDNVWHISGTQGYNFVTLGDAPVFTYPVNTLTGVPILPNFTWTYPAGLAAPVSVSLSVIKVEPGAVAALASPANDATSYQWTETNGILSNNASYNVTLSYTDANGISGSKTINFKTFAVTAFGLSLPIDGQTNVPRSSLPFYWYNTAGGVKYLLEVIADPGHALIASDWTTPAFTADNLTAVNTTLTNLAFNQKYFWRVKAKHATTGAVLAVTGVYNFTTGGGVVKPYLSYPVAQPVYENLPTFYWWGLNFDPQNVYDLSIYDALGTTLIYQKTNISGTNHKLVASNFLVGSALAGNTTYTWFVIAKSSAAGEQTFSSDATTFTTLGAGTVYQPVCSYPTDLSEVYSVTPTLYWYIGGATSGITYTVTISTDPLFGVGTIVESGTTATDELTYAVSTNLSAGQTYYWKVKASNGTIAQDQTSTVASFVVSPTLAPGDPVALWPVDNPTEYSLKPSLNWWVNGSTSGITGFDLVWTTAPVPVDDAAWSLIYTTGPALRKANVLSSVTNYTLTDPQVLSNGVQYYWAVRKTGGTSWSVGSFTTVSATVATNGTPVPSWPVGGAQASSTTPQLSWWMNGSTTGLASYTVEYSRTEDFNSNSDAFGPYTISVPGLPNNNMSYQVASPLLQGTTYYWRVIAVFPGPVTTTSATESFVVQSPNGVIAPVAGSPINNVQVKNNNPVLSWAIPTKTTASMTYEAQYSTKPDMSNPVSITGLKSNKAAVTGLKNGTYYWRVRSVDTKGAYSGYSSKESFVVTGTTAVEQRPGVPTDFALEQNYPNPFNPSTVIRFSLPDESRVSLKIYDIMGQEVKTLLNETMNAGNFDVQWNGDDSHGNKVQSGTYIYRITTENNSVARKMMLIK